MGRDIFGSVESGHEEDVRCKMIRIANIRNIVCQQCVTARGIPSIGVSSLGVAGYGIDGGFFRPHHCTIRAHIKFPLFRLRGATFLRSGCRFVASKYY
eukprot:scaffold10860_cov182-Amphora_coffeaeformis.AAC.27